MAAPTLNQRQECYLARDEFYECMVKNNEQAEACMTQRQKYSSKCLSSWVSIYYDLTASKSSSTAHLTVFQNHFCHSPCTSLQVKYFDRKRVYDEYKKKLESAGYQPLPEKDGEE